MFRPEAYSEHCQTSTMERFAKNTCLAHFSAQSQKKKKEKKNIHPKKISYIFSKETKESCSCISGNGNLVKNFHIF